MKLVTRLEDLMWENRIKSINQLSDKTGISRTTLTRLKKNQSQGVNAETVETLCKFFDCDIQELLVFISDQEYKEMMKAQEREGV